MIQAVKKSVLDLSKSVMVVLTPGLQFGVGRRPVDLSWGATVPGLPTLRVGEETTWGFGGHRGLWLSCC